MKITRAQKVELDPNKAHRIYFHKAFGIARYAYNYALKLHEEQYKATGKNMSASDMNKKLCSEKKTLCSWMYEVTKCAPQAVINHLEEAYTKFFKKQAQHPVFKKKGKARDSFIIDNSALKARAVKGRHVIIPKLGPVRLKQEVELEGKFLFTTISREADRYFISFVQEVEIEVKEEDKPTGKPVGIDLGIKTLITTSDGEIKEEFDFPFDYKAEEAKVKKAQKRLSRKQKGSKNRAKQRIKVARAHRKLRNKRQDFIHKTTYRLAKTKSVIVMEDLSAKGMVKNHNLAKAISNAAFGEIKRQLEYKTIWYGSKLLLVSRWFPSNKTCSKCGYVHKDLKLGDRSWTCPICGTVHERDFNAATNILVEGLNTVSHTGIYACGDGSSSLMQINDQPVEEARSNKGP